MKKIPPSSTLFLALSLLISTGCAQVPLETTTTFYGKWEFIEQPGQPVKACLVENDVAKLREILIRCRAAQ